MNVKTKIKIGTDEFEIAQDVKSQTEFFEFSAFFSSIPKVGPNGETDLKLVHRTPQGYNYYSIVSEKAKMEYKFGQSKENIGSLFGKGWEPLYQKEGAETGATPSAVPSTGLAIGVTQVQAPSLVQQAAPTPVAQPAVAVQAPTPTPVAQPAPAIATQPTATPAAAPRSAEASSVLARFGLNTNKNAQA